jgi:hypothetical protein
MPKNAYSLITKLKQNKNGRVLYEGEVYEYKVCDALPWISDYEFAIILEDGTEVILSDAYENMGFVCRAPDSGTQMTNIFVPEADPVDIPDREDLKTNA